MAQPKLTTDPDKLLERVVLAATGGTAFSGINRQREISEREKESLSRAIGRDVEQWRAEFAVALRRTGSKLLQRLEDSIDDIKPDALAYSLAVVADKASALDGRNQVNAASVNIQVNNYGTASKESLLAMLNGQEMAAQESAKNGANESLLPCLDVPQVYQTGQDSAAAQAVEPTQAGPTGTQESAPAA